MFEVGQRIKLIDPENMGMDKGREGAIHTIIGLECDGIAIIDADRPLRVAWGWVEAGLAEIVEEEE